jgi:simple sugar transport system ATP-binding protein
LDHGAAAVSSPALELRGIRKRYPGVLACDDIDLACESGRVHAVVGENGAGKSTLFNIAAGLVEPDAGVVRIGGVELGRGGAAAARRLGLGMVHQHFLLVPTLTVADNVVLGREPGRGPWYDRAAAAARANATARRWGLEIDVQARVADLTVGEQQRVEILRVLDAGARVLVLDEPTAVLSPPEIEAFLAILRALAAAGHAVILVSHRLPEVLAVADAITVLRAGRVVSRVERAAATEADLARAIVGRPLVPAAPRAAPAPGAAVLQLEDVVTGGKRGALRGVSLSVQSGEIVGVAGVEGNGQRALLQAILGLEPVVAGRIELLGRDVTTTSVRARRRAGVAYVSEDRLGEGLVPAFDLAENLLLSPVHADALDRRAWWRRRAWRRRAAAILAAGDVRPPDPARSAATLSGGNQQKLILAREVAAATRLLVLGQPTRGIDVGGIEFVQARIRAARAAGAAVLLVSCDLGEILALADRIVVLFAGRLRGPFAADAVTPELLGRFMTGGGEAA